MNCEKVRPLLGRFYDCNLDWHSEVGVESHLGNCRSCSVEFERLQKLSGVLQNSFIPAPTASLDEMIMRDIRRESDFRQSPKAAWWKGIFIGSVSVPKPAFAVAIILIAVGLALSNFLGRNAAASFSAAAPDALTTSSPLPLKPNETDKTKIAEVPVVRERIVKQIIYVERHNPNGQKQSDRYAVSERYKFGSKKRSRKITPPFKQNVPDSRVNDSIAENGYFTRTNLSVFQPVREMKTRIIKETQDNEK